jgi:hypothetical protein
MSGAYRDAGAAIERAEALEREVEELRAEMARLRSESSGRKTFEPARVPPDVREMHDELVNLRAENELLRGASSGGSGDASTDYEIIRERDSLRREVKRLQAQIEDLRAKVAERDGVDNRDAVIERLTEERIELERELKEARERYEAEPPASRDPKNFEERVLAILNRLVK